MINCVFENNVTPSGGGAVSVYGGMITISGCRFVDNQAAEGGAVSIRYAAAYLEGCTFQNNLAGMGGGLYLDAPYDGLVSQCTFFGNRADQGGAAAVVGIQINPLNFFGCILAGSAFGEGLFWDGANDLVLTSCDIFGNAGGDWVGPLEGAEEEKFNLHLDPLFCDAEDGDFSLAANSPCLPENSPGGVLVGAWGMGCGASAVGDLPGRELALRCYPNPFNPRVNIHFTLERAQPVRVEIFGLNGRRVARLNRGAMSAGPQHMVWHGQTADGVPVPSGSYLVRVSTAEGTAHRKVLLLK